MRAFVIYALYRLLGALVGPLPPRAGYWLARRAGGVLCRFSPGLRQTLVQNLRHVLGPAVDEERVQDLTRQACINVAKGHYELFRVSRLTPNEIQDIVQVAGFQYLEQAMALGKGVIVVTAHLGNVDLMAQLPLAYGIPISGAAWHSEPERLFRYTLKLRQKHGLRLFPSDGAMMGLVRALKRGELIALPCDRDFADNSRTVDFFGQPARLPYGPVRLSRRTGAPLLPAFVERLPDETFSVHVEPPVIVPRTDDAEADIDATMAKLVSIMERYISQHPEQWLVAAPVWLTEKRDDNHVIY
ncbi:MAG: lysophospholipid acyltransferase family protein [Anaerolineae bacterium]